MRGTGLDRHPIARCFIGGFAWTGLGSVAVMAPAVIFGADPAWVLALSPLGAIVASLFGWRRHGPQLRRADPPGPTRGAAA